MATLESMVYHLRGNFYPPLPHAYAEPALEALARCEEEDYEATIVLPLDIEPHPKVAVKTDMGWEISAGELIRILRLDY